jgi:hypothetical protein
MRRIPHLILILCVSASAAFSQGEIPVDMYTGQPSITVPIWTLSSGDIVQPIALSYNANAIHSLSTCGPGWSISAGGSISREVRTYPDDIGYEVTTKGWLYKNSSNVDIATDIGNFVPAADDSTLWDSGESTDHTKISGFNYAVDTEPDVFHYSAGGISGSFVFDNTLGIRTIPYADVVITPTYTGGGNKKITSFTITTNTGFVYTFGYVVNVIKSAAVPTYNTNSSFWPAVYEFYNPSVTFTGEWKLTRIDSPNGAYLTFSYSSRNDVNNWEVEAGQYQFPDPSYADPSDLTTLTLYTLSETNQHITLSSIVGSTGARADFAYIDGLLQDITIKDTRRGTTLSEQTVKKFTCGYLPVTYTRDYLGYFPAYTTQFLNSITESSGCERLAPYTFQYLGFYTVGAQYNHPGLFLRHSSTVDPYGNPNGNENAYPRIYIYPDEPMIDRYRTTSIPDYPGTEYGVSGVASRANFDGLLGSITTPEGGVTTFRFEPNDYLDPRTNTVETADGLRIKKIEYHDGFNHVPIVKTFQYTDPETGLSSGRIIRKPVFATPAFRKGNQTFSDLSDEEEQFQYLMIRGTSDMTQGETTNGNPVGYKFVTVARPGAGFARFEFSLPASFGDEATGDWTPTINKFARSSDDSSVSMGIVDGASAWSFPFTPNPNYDYQRGLLLKKSDYTRDSSLVQETITIYQTLYKSGSTPHKVYGLKYDRYPGYNGEDKIFFYGRYYLLTDAITVPEKEISIRYDLTDATGNTWQKDSVEYVYGSSYHKLLTQVRRHTVDGDLYTTRLKYSKDYAGNPTTGDADAVSIYTMKFNNRHSMPIETIQTFKKAGNDTVWVVGGTLVKLDPLGLSTPRVRSVWSLNGAAPINIQDWVESAIVYHSDYKLWIDPRYHKVDSIIGYTALGNVQSSYNPTTRRNSAIGYGYGLSAPVVQLVNATPGQAAFADFETYVPGFSFSSGTPYYGTGRTGKNAFYPGVTLVDTLTKANVSNYILSFWINSNTTVSFTVDLKNPGGTALSPAASTSFSVTSSGGSSFKYVQQVIPIPGNVPSTFRVEFKATGVTTPPSGGSAPGLLPVIDDVFFYPENADMMATQYQFPFGTASVTTGTGQGSFTEYDKLGRPQFIFDKNKDIVKRNVYQYATESPLIADFTINTVTVGESTTFRAVTTECVTDATYEWDLGAGFVSGADTLVHTYDTLGVKTVSMRVTSTSYGTKTITKSFSIVTSPFEIEICIKGPSSFVNGEPDIIEVCTAITSNPPANGMIFKVDPVGSGSFTYQWKMRDLGSATWVDVGRNSDEYSINKLSALTSNASFEVVCKVTAPTGKVGYSPIRQIIFYEY